MLSELEAAGLGPTSVAQLADAHSRVREAEDQARQKQVSAGKAYIASVSGMAMGLTGRLLTVLKLMFQARAVLAVRETASGP